MIKLNKIDTDANHHGANADVNGISGFSVGVYTAAKSIKLDQQFQFAPVYCDGMTQCSQMLLEKKVSALLVPTADVLTYFVTEKLASTSCGNPMRMTGPAVLTDQFPAVKMCSYSRSVYAAVYLTNAINKQLDNLEASGLAAGLRDVLNQQVSDTSAADSCNPGLEYQLAIVIPAGATILVYWVVISWINHRKRAAQGRAIRSFFGQTQKTPEQLALYYGLKWKSNAKKFSLARQMVAPRLDLFVVFDSSLRVHGVCVCVCVGCMANLPRARFAGQGCRVPRLQARAVS